METCKKCGGTNITPRKVCRDCRAAYMRAWNARNPDKVRANKQRRDPAKVKAERDRDRAKNRTKRYASRDAAIAKKPEHYAAYKKAWYQANKERMLRSCKEAAARRLAANPVGERRKRAAYMNRRRQEKPQVRIYCRMSSLIRGYLKTQNRNPQSKAGRQWPQLVGYTVRELIAHLKTTIPPGYLWDDYLSGALEVDHIVPDAKWQYETVDDPGFKGSWAMTNLRLLTKEENNARRYAIQPLGVS